MKLVLTSLILFLTISCNSVPKYKVNDCFKIGPFIIVQIVEITKTDYKLIVNNIFYKEQKSYKFDQLEKTVEEQGIIVQSCNYFYKKD